MVFLDLEFTADVLQRADVLTPAFRQELVAWVNSLLQLNLTKVEQCGTGYEDREGTHDLTMSC